MSAKLQKQISLEKTFKKKTENKANIRISVPDFRKEKFENILIHILNNFLEKPDINNKFLYNLFYFLDFNFYEIYEEHLTGTTYVKLSCGAVPKIQSKNFSKLIISKKIEDKNIKTYLQDVTFRNIDTLKGKERKVVDYVISKFSCFKTSDIIKYAKKDMPLLATKKGEEINYELAFYREPPYSVRNYGV